MSPIAIVRSFLTVVFVSLIVPTAYAQGQDSKTYERDLMVIAQMLAGEYDNANQSYFDGRTKANIKHNSLHLKVESISQPELGQHVFRVDGYFNGQPEQPVAPHIWVLSADDESQSVRMRRWILSEQLANRNDLRRRDLGKDYCDIFWRREAQQFRATQTRPCEGVFADEYVLSEQQLWVNLPTVENGNYQLHRARLFECYADIPGVGGGRDEPYDRYDGIKLHDQGDQHWFTSKEGRRLGISLFLVDWPINNYKGVFTRDSFVIYISEEIDGERKELGYAFTEPTAERIGINLKWMLASCFMRSNKHATPTM